MPAGLLYCKFVRRTNGTGTVLSTTQLGSVEGDPCPAAFFAYPEGPLSMVRVQVHYFSAPASDSPAHLAAARLAASAYLDSLRLALLHQEPVVHNLPRGRAVMPNIGNNFGDLIYYTDLLDASGLSGTTILANCTLFSASVVDDPGIEGLTLDLVFGKVSASALP